MAHFAKINDNTNIVVEINVVDNADIQNLEFPKSEPIGIEFLTAWTEPNTYWKQTSYNSSFRGQYAGIGDIYDTANDVFYKTQPYPSWTLNKAIWTWESPVPRPIDGKTYEWDESIINWVEANTPQPADEA